MSNYDELGYGRKRLIDRLRKGPLWSDEYSEVCRSAASLRVTIANLRRMGWQIQTDRLRRWSGDPMFSDHTSLKARYRLDTPEFNPDKDIRQRDTWASYTRS